MELVILATLATLSVIAAGFGIKAYRKECAELARAEEARSETRRAFIAHYKAQLEAVRKARAA